MAHIAKAVRMKRTLKGQSRSEKQNHHIEASLRLFPPLRALKEYVALSYRDAAVVVTVWAITYVQIFSLLKR
jgi:hypothetical protein